jgi:hypothetical protein
LLKLDPSNGVDVTAQAAMKEWSTTVLRPIFKSHGYRSKGLTFYRQAEDNFAVVQLQKSVHSTSSVVEFTVNLAVFSARVQRSVSKYLWMPEINGVPSESACHLRQRIGLLTPEKRDLWWSIPEGGVPFKLAATIASLLEKYAFPFLETRTSDEGLRDHWLQHLPRGPAALGLAVLVRDLGPPAKLMSLLDQIRENSGPGAALFIKALDQFSKDVKRPGEVGGE